METYIIIILSILFLIFGWISTTYINSQFVNLFGILLYGPFLIWLSSQVKDDWIQIILLFLGLTIVSYNIKKYGDIDKNVEITHPAIW